MSADKLQEIRERLAAIEDPIALLEGIFAFSPVGFQIYRADGRCALVNQAFRDLFGSEPPPEYNVLEDEIAREAGVLDLIHRAFAGEIVHIPPVWYDPRELRQVRVTEGKRVAIASTFFPLLDRDGRVTHVAIVFKDVTAEQEARERAEAVAKENERLLHEAKEAVRARDDFLSIASHELRTPLTPLQLRIQSMLRALEREPPESGARAWLPKVEDLDRGIGRLSGLVAELLDISRITAGRLKLHPEEIDLAEVVREVLARFAEEAASAGSTVRVHLPATVIGRWDPMRLDQIVSNLVSNAIKYGSGKPIEVEVRADAARATIRVRDEGIGIAAEDQARIFERFERVQPSVGIAGFGLGLWIVRQVVEAFGGSIRVESTAGRGSTFTVELPRG